MSSADPSKLLKSAFKEEIQNRILSGSLQPGARLPSERELAREFGISRGSVNQGILDLERMGFLRVIPRKGTFVEHYYQNPQTLNSIMSYDSALIDKSLFMDFMSLRILIERECVRLACQNMNAEKIETLENMTSKIYSAADDAVPDALYQYHKGLVMLSGNKAYALVFQNFEPMLRNMIRRHYKVVGELDKCLPLYEKLSYAIQTSNAAFADTFITSILQLAASCLDKDLSRNTF